jgi:hypothetical protein
VIVVVNAEALRRGAAEGEERCEIRGVGPISVGAARRLLTQSVLDIVIAKGVDVMNVTLAGRRIPQEFLSALWATHDSCADQLCDVTAGLEKEHVKDYAKTKVTRLADLQLLCRRQHRQKTNGGFEVEGSFGQRRLIPPERPPPDPP